MTTPAQPHPLSALAAEYILTTACTLVTDHGYGALTYEAVAVASRLTKPTLYKYYPDRTLFDAVVTRMQTAQPTT
jgi:AcrR family transcriptional regulator